MLTDSRCCTIAASSVRESALHRVEAVVPTVTGNDACIFKERVCVKAFVKIDGASEEVYDLFLRFVVSVTRWFEGRNASSMLSPFVLPETFVVSAIILPVCVHETQKVGLTIRLENFGNVCVLTVFVTILLVGAVAVVWPEELFEMMS